MHIYCNVRHWDPFIVQLLTVENLIKSEYTTPPFVQATPSPNANGSLLPATSGGSLLYNSYTTFTLPEAAEIDLPSSTGEFTQLARANILGVITIR